MRKHEPVELVQIAIPILIEVVCVSLFIAGVMAWVIIMATPVPEVLQ